MALALSYGTNANNGNVLTQVTTLPGAAFSQTYNYDQVNRLCSVREQATATPLAAYSCTATGALESGETWRQRFGYDRFGNQWVAQHLGTNMPYSGQRPTTQSNFDANTNRLVESAGQVGYDATGNQTTHGGWTLAYDAEGRIKTATPSSGNAATYEYDADGRRVKKIVGSTATWFVYDVSGQLAAEYTAAGPTGSAETHFLTTDHLGSTRLVTNQSAAVVSRHDYLPFGEEIPNNLGGRSTSLGYQANANLTHRFTGVGGQMR
jgi:YD repeat-containing protein